MNNDRRQRLFEVYETLCKCRDEQQDYLDNMPENWQDSERGELAQEAIDKMESAIEVFHLSMLCHFDSCSRAGSFVEAKIDPSMFGLY